MTVHIGQHPINDTQEETDKYCGFCGQTGCNSTLTVSSRGKKKTYYKVESNCPYKYLYKQYKSSDSHPCSNYLLKCPVKECATILWSYCLQAHFKISDHEELCTEGIITEKEIKNIKKFCKKNKC